MKSERVEFIGELGEEGRVEVEVALIWRFGAETGNGNGSGPTGIGESQIKRQHE